mmetsp:Transcript_15964/g.24739  ORF Transcript_15964/g.24739 Transcript_15964/m.24739 type:complete len:83 (-) Transcript_15964:1093-1341(-)
MLDDELINFTVTDADLIFRRITGQPHIKEHYTYENSRLIQASSEVYSSFKAKKELQERENRLSFEQFVLALSEVATEYYLAK